MEQSERFALIRVAGRGDWAVYHLLSDDDTSPVCDAPIRPEQWDAITENDARRAGRHHPARRCCQRCNERRAAS